MGVGGVLIFMESRIIIKNIHKQFNDTDIFSGINLEIPAKEITVLIGPNGCGKTTLFHILSGLITADNGEYYVQNFDPYLFSYLMQDYRATLMPWLTNLENILFPLRLQKKHDLTIVQKINMLKQIIHTNFPLEGYPYELSGGQQQMVALWRALITEPNLLFIDEPLSALDPENTHKFRKVLLNYQAEHQATIIMISHNIDEALFLSDNIVILSEKPTTVANIIKNELPKQQRSNLTTSPMFNELRDRVITALRYKI